MLNFQGDYKTLAIAIKTDIDRFVAEHGIPKSLGIYSCPHYGWVSLNYNTDRQLVETGFNCSDFEFVEYGFIELPKWEAAYENEILLFIDQVGEKQTLVHNFENEVFAKPFFELLLAVAQDLKRTCRIEFLVQILDSRLAQKS